MEGIIRKAKRTLTEEEVEGKIRLTGLTLQSSILLSSLPPFLSSFTTSFGAIGEAVFKVLHVVDDHAQMCLLTLLQNTYHSCRPVFTLQQLKKPLWSLSLHHVCVSKDVYSQAPAILEKSPPWEGHIYCAIRCQVWWLTIIMWKIEGSCFIAWLQLMGLTDFSF